MKLVHRIPLPPIKLMIMSEKFNEFVLRFLSEMLFKEELNLTPSVYSCLDYSR